MIGANVVDLAFGLVIPKGIAHIAQRVSELIEDATNELPGSFRLLIKRLPVRPDWQVDGGFGRHIFAIRPYTPNVSQSVSTLVAHLRASLAGGVAVDKAAKPIRPARSR